MKSKDYKAREAASAAVSQEELAMRGLPRLCYHPHPWDDSTVLIKRGMVGYFETQYPSGDADRLNEELGVTKVQAKAMYFGSLWGFHTPGADPSHSMYQKD